MEEQTKDTVRTIRELEGEARLAIDELMEYVSHYERSRSADATDEERFSEGRYGRTIVHHIDAAISALTSMRMRVNLQQEGRDSARAKQLDRILGLSEEDTQLVDSMLDIAEGVIRGQRVDIDYESDDGREEG